MSHINTTRLALPLLPTHLNITPSRIKSIEYSPWDLELNVKYISVGVFAAGMAYIVYTKCQQQVSNENEVLQTAGKLGKGSVNLKSSGILAFDSILSNLNAPFSMT